MKTIWIDGKKMAKEVTDALRPRVAHLTRVPRLDVIWVGDNLSSEIYVAIPFLYKKIKIYNCKCME